MEIGTHVAWKHDSRLTGIIVGFGTVDNGADPRAADDLSYEVAIVRMDNGPFRHDKIPVHITFHMPIETIQLKAITKEAADA